MLPGRASECGRSRHWWRGPRRDERGAGAARRAGDRQDALLEHAAAVAGAATVSRARGVESEVQVAFGGLHELLRPVLGELGACPTRRARRSRPRSGSRRPPRPSRIWSARRRSACSRSWRRSARSSPRRRRPLARRAVASRYVRRAAAARGRGRGAAGRARGPAVADRRRRVRGAGVAGPRRRAGARAARGACRAAGGGRHRGLAALRDGRQPAGARRARAEAPRLRPGPVADHVPIGARIERALGRRLHRLPPAALPSLLAAGSPTATRSSRCSASPPSGGSLAGLEAAEAEARQPCGRARRVQPPARAVRGARAVGARQPPRRSPCVRGAPRSNRRRRAPRVARGRGDAAGRRGDRGVAGRRRRRRRGAGWARGGGRRLRAGRPPQP